MSHFCVLVIGNDPDKQLAKYDENLELDMHLVLTKEQIIQKQRIHIESYRRNYYDVYLSDPEKYKENCHNPNHIIYLTEEFPKKLKFTDEQLYEEYIKDYRDYIADGDDWCEIHDDGSLWKTSNEDAKWDYYQIGGRYRGRLRLKEPNDNAPLYTGWPYGENDHKEYGRIKSEGYCDQALAKDVANLDNFVPFAIVKDGEWYERGEMGWFGCASNEKNIVDWDAEVKTLLKDLPGDTLLTVMDCHI